MTQLNVANPISLAVAHIPGMRWLTFVVSLGAIAGLTSVMVRNLCRSTLSRTTHSPIRCLCSDCVLVCRCPHVQLVTLMGQPRIFFAMACDGLFPSFAKAVHPRFKTPYITTAITGVLCALCAAILPIDVLSELSSIGTLFAFFMVRPHHTPTYMPPTQHEETVDRA